MSEQPDRTEVKREEFADGSALVACQDGSQLILESKLARQVALRERREVNYGSPPPPPPSAGSKPLAAAEDFKWDP